MGFTPEDIAAAREALNDGSKRMKLDRRLPREVLFFHDNGMAASSSRPNRTESEGSRGILLAVAGINASDKGV